MNCATIQIKPFESSKALQDAVLQELTRLFCLETVDHFAVILSGGNTPLPVYRALAQSQITPSPALHLTLSDERYVPCHDPRNNASYVVPFMNQLNIRQDRLLRVDTTLSIQDAANRFDRNLHRWIGQRMQFPLGLLGIGTDGHTASLFSRDDIDAGKNRLAIAVKRPAPPDRISMTPAMLQRIQRIILLAAGAEKRDIIHTLLHAPETIPCGIALQQAPHVELWTDQPA
jgi:6-phosphogluconolactonase